MTTQYNQEDKALNVFMDKVQKYLDHQKNQVENLTWLPLSSILDRWYYKHQLKRDLDMQDLEQTKIDVNKFICTVDGDIHSLLKEKDPTSAIESYMVDFNERLFDAVSGLVGDANSERNINTLPEPYIRLISELRWVSTPRDTPGTIEYQLQEDIIDYNYDLYQFIIGTGIELDDLVRNFSSIRLTDELRTELNKLIN